GYHLMKRTLILLATLLLTFSFAYAEDSKTVEVYPVTVAPELYTAFPQSEGTDFADGIKTGFGSAITFKGYDEDGNLQFYGASDRGPSLDLTDKDGNEVENTKVFPVPDFSPVIGTITLKDGKAVVEEAITLKKADGTPLTGLPLPAGETGATGEIALDIYGNELTYDPEGFDPEGIALDKDGNFWLGDEYGPFIGKFSADGTLIKMYKPGDGLPEILKYRIANRGFESLTISPSGKVFAIQQSVMDIEGETQKTATFIRILELDPETGATKMYAYPVDLSEYSKPKNCKLGDAFAIDDTTLLVVEQGTLADDSMRNIIYQVDLSNATDITGLTYNDKELEYTASAEELATVMTYAEKEVYVDLRTLNWTAEKAEGICLTDNGELVAIIEDDFGMAGAKEVEGEDAYTILPNLADPSQIWVIK
ncbi:MAG: esterase-like activity of phytase family protein, partial [Clostridia bacterium]|nr:esterase-like activity of phytase family protein [Clostridia bacterium]